MTQINLGNFGYIGQGANVSYQLNLISPYKLANGDTYYYLDANGDGKSDAPTESNWSTPDAVLRQALDVLFNNSADTSSNTRSVVLGGYKLSLPTVAELTTIRAKTGGAPPQGWSYVPQGHVATYHTADQWAENSHSIFGLSNGQTYSRGGLETDNISQQFVAIKVESVGGGTSGGGTSGGGTSGGGTSGGGTSGGGTSGENLITDLSRTISTGTFPDVAVLKNGDYVVAWREFKSTYDVEGYFQRFDSNGATLTEKIIFSDNLVQINTIVTAKSDGGFIVGGLLGGFNRGYSWNEYDSKNTKINSRRLLSWLFSFSSS
jgi:hypothetical protein